eukprot:scaffold20827_cov129-Isochrysis_galbana.AAC.2
MARTLSPAAAPARTARMCSARRLVRKGRVSRPTLESNGAHEEAPSPVGTVIAHSVARAALGYSSAETHRLAIASCVIGATCSRDGNGRAGAASAVGGLGVRVVARGMIGRGG